MKNWTLFYPFIIAATLVVGSMLLILLPDYLFVLIPGIAILPAILLFIYLEKKRPFNSIWNQDAGDKKADLIRTFLT
jgi:hypothetical protein